VLEYLSGCWTGWCRVDHKFGWRLTDNSGRAIVDDKGGAQLEHEGNGRQEQDRLHRSDSLLGLQGSLTENAVVVVCVRTLRPSDEDEGGRGGGAEKKQNSAF